MIGPLARSWIVLCLTVSSVYAQDTTASALATGPGASRGVNRAHFDTTCSPCRDFYQFANGGWLQRTHLGWTGTERSVFGEVSDVGMRMLVAAVREASAQSPYPVPVGQSGKDTTTAVAGDSTLYSATRLVGALYNRCSEQSAIEAAGTNLVAPWLKRINAIRSPVEAITVAASLDRAGIQTMLYLRIQSDHLDPRRMTVSLARAGLGLPDPGLYTRTDPLARTAQSAYLAHVEKILTLLGRTPNTATSEATAVISLEARLAHHRLSDSAIRDPYATYHPMPTRSLTMVAPTIAWAQYFAALEIAPPDTINVEQPLFLATLDTALRQVPIAVWRAYLSLRLVDQLHQTLGTPFGSSYSALSDRLNGVPVRGGGTRNCLHAVEHLLRDATGRLYAAKVFPPEAKARATALVNHLKVAMRLRIESNPWMTAETKTQALEKLSALRVKIGYPDQWRDYTGLTLTPTSYTQQTLEILQFERDREFERIGKTREGSGWHMSPATVNAYYDHKENEIVFPAAILAPPFFDLSADDASNYGGIGTVIGHEITHAFDDRGRRFDAEGRLRDWWTPADGAEFVARAEQLVAQYSGYRVVDTTYLNGRRSLGENVADLGGVLVAYDALQIALKDKPTTRLDGFTPEQRFFIAYANVFRQKFRPETYKTRMLIVPHAPGQWRINGVLVNVPAFAQAFGCKKGDGMAPANHRPVTIW